jgi:GntR family transcriptional regulator, arabinose operon transcriptional repressor
LRSDIVNGRMPYGTLLPTEKELGVQMGFSRPTIAKIYNALKKEGLVKKTQGQGTTVVYHANQPGNSFGLLLPGAGESEIFGEIHDHFLTIEKEKQVKFLWDGAIANNAQVRQNSILGITERYVSENVKGVFFAPLERTERANEISQQVCDYLDKKNIPVILIDRDIKIAPERSKYPVVGIDNFSAAYRMTQHLVEAGCEKIYFFRRKDSASSVDKRVGGVSKACFDFDIPFTKKQIITGEPSDIQLIKPLKIIPGKTGILCANDSTAAIVMSMLKQIDVIVPKDVLIAGFDDMKYGKVLQPSLTTYRQPLRQIVNFAYDMMVNINNKSLATDITLNGELVARESTVFV